MVGSNKAGMISKSGCVINCLNNYASMIIWPGSLNFSLQNDLIRDDFSFSSTVRRVATY